MTKRILAFLIATMIFTSVFINAAGVVVAESNDPFAFFDARREALLEGNVSQISTPSQGQPSDGDDYIVTFGGSKSTVAKALSGYDYRPLAYSSELVFLVKLKYPEAFVKENAAVIRFFEKDAVRTVEERNHAFGQSDKPWELDCLNVENIPYGEISTASRVVVAMIDSGVNRNHPALKNARILDGYDITDNYSAVNRDTSGHGTRIAGIIAAQTDVTAAFGIAQFATLLPIRVSENGKDIKTSDLVDAIYMAADAGADIINMSFGGYERIRAEEDAVAYAVSKGCLMVAASGNEGSSRDFAGEYSYPASYDNVISVASVGQNDVACGFSQYNDMVDIAAPGEFLTLLGSTSGVMYDNGTSFSAAYVSAAAALADAYCGRRLGSAAFEKLLEYATGKTEKSDYTGYGTLDIAALLEVCRYPIVYGVSDGGTCFDRVNISFEGDSATIDGEDFSDGGNVYSHGLHTVIVTNSFGSRSVTFMLDTMQLKYTYRNAGSFCVFLFSRGNADIDGIPYASGSHFTLEGDHVFTLRGPSGNTVQKEFSFRRGLPEISGVEDGKTYNSFVRITAAGRGTVLLDGVSFTDEITVTENGIHTLDLSSQDGDATKTITFTIDTTSVEYRKTFTKSAEIFVDEALGIAVFASRGGRNILTVPLDDMESDGRLLFLPDTILDIGFYDGKLCVVHKKGFVFYDIAPLFSMLPLSYISYLSDDEYNDAVIDSDGVVYASQNNSIVRTPFDTMLNEELLKLSSPVTQITVSDNYYRLCAKNGLLYSYSKSERRLVGTGDTLPCGALLKATDSYLYCTGGVADGKTFECLLRYSDENIAVAPDGRIAAGHELLGINGIPDGMFGKPVSSIAEGDSHNYILFDDGSLCRVEKAAHAASSPEYYGASPYTADAQYAAYDFTPFERLLPVGERNVLAMQTYGDSLYVIYENTNRIYVYSQETLALTRTVALRYTPIALASDETGVAAIFRDTACIWSTNGGYASLPFVPTAIATDRMQYLISGGALYRRDPQNGTTSRILENIEVESVTAANGVLYVGAMFDISAFDANTLSLISATEQTLGGDLRVSDGYLISGSYLIDKETLNFVTSCGSAAYTILDGAAITSRGLFGISDERYISHTYSGITAAVKGSNNAVFVAYNGSIRRISYIGDPATPAGFDFSDGDTLQSGETVYCEIGLLYLNGKPVENGFSAKSGDMQTLTAVRPWGVSETIHFSVRPDPTDLVLKLSRQHMSPGETAHLVASILPQGAEGNITYHVDGESIVLREGVVTAVSTGISYIVASIDGTDISAQLTVTVSGDTLQCTNPTYTHDPHNDTLSNIPAYTTVNQLLSSFTYTSGDLRLVTPDGMIRKSGYVSTGCKLIYRSGDNDLETIEISVRGDLDGDGMVTVNDANMLYLKLRSETEFTPAVFKAADINQNGKLTAADQSQLSMLVGRTPHSSVKNVLHPTIDAPSIVGGNGAFSVTVTVGELRDSSSMMATLTYDSTMLEYLSSSYYEGSVSASASDGALFFTALDINSASEERVIKIYFKAKQGAVGKASMTLINGEVYTDSLYRMSDTDATVTLVPAASNLAIESSNSNLAFTPSVTRYAISALNTAPSLDMSFSVPAGGQLYLPDLSLDNTTTQLTVRYITPAGRTVNYVFIITKTESLPKTDSTALLSALSVIGNAFTSEFDPKVFIYTLTVDSDVEEVSFDYDPQNAGTLITVSPEGPLEYGDNIITVACKAENGDSATYTVIITRRFPTEESSEESDESSESSERSVEPISDISVIPSVETSGEAPIPSDRLESAALAITAIVALLLIAVAIALRKSIKK
ncbi:MAG: S8 family serine peptidase [Ruminococcus sp.]|nr:S8 family serine peptidase [Ruminococcus sp.]